MRAGRLQRRLPNALSFHNSFTKGPLKYSKTDFPILSFTSDGEFPGLIPKADNSTISYEASPYIGHYKEYPLPPGIRGVFCRQKRNEVHFLLVSLALGFPKECLCFVQSVILIILVDIIFTESGRARITKYPTIKPRKRRPVSSSLLSGRSQVQTPAGPTLRVLSN